MNLHSQGWMAIVAALGVLALGSCTAWQGEYELYSAGFQYDDFQMTCGREEVVAGELLKAVSPDLLAYIRRDDGLRGVDEVIDLSRPNMTGYKKIGSRNLVKYLFATYLMPDMLIPGEGGIIVVADPCKRRLLYVNYYRYP